MISLKNISFSYSSPLSGKKIEVFKNISISFEKGKIYVITAPNGYGKTTLLNIISSIDSKYNGNVKFMGMDLSKAKEDEKNRLRLKEIGFVFQFGMVCK